MKIETRHSESDYLNLKEDDELQYTGSFHSVAQCCVSLGCGLGKRSHGSQLSAKEKGLAWLHASGCAMGARSCEAVQRGFDPR